VTQPGRPRARRGRGPRAQRPAHFTRPEGGVGPAGAVGSGHVTSTETMPAADASTPRKGGTARERRGARARGRRIARAAVVSRVVTLLTLGGGGGAWYVLATQADLADRAAAARSLLTESEGKVDDDATRAALSAQIEATDALLDEPLLTRLTTGTSETSDALAAASEGVHASMIDYARDQVAQARAGLDSAEATARKYYEATEGLGVEDGIRAQVQEALTTTAAATEAAEAGLAGSDLAQLEKAAYDLAANRSVIALATDTLAEAQDAVTCPEDDQTWHPDSGK